MKLPKSVIPLLKTATDQMANNTCNDYRIPDTPENRKFIEAMHQWNGDSEGYIAKDGWIYTMDWFVLGYITHLVEQCCEQ